jgi:hypothetical protein
MGAAMSLRRRHGRNAGYPAPPVQSRTCSFPASGSSVARASAQAVSVSGHPLCAMARREVGSGCSGPTCPGCVAFPGCVLPSRPAPCDGLSPPQRTLLDTPPQSYPVGLPCASTPPPAWAWATAVRRFPHGSVSGFPLPCLRSWRPDTDVFHGRNGWGLPRASTPLCLPATA